MKQHHIPKSYLSSWCDKKTPEGQEPFVWRFVKDGSVSKNKAPKKIFFEKDMYTIENVDGEKSFVIEHGLKQLEDIFTDIRRKKISKLKSLNVSEKIYLCAFLAAMNARTKLNRDHHKKTWQNVVEVGNKIKEEFDKSTDEQKKSFTDMSDFFRDRESISFEEAKELAEKPLQKLLFTDIKVTTPKLSEMNMCTLITDDEIGFITSDNPCVWFDPEGYKRQPYYQSPGFQYKSLEITFPVSPNSLLLLSYSPLKSYIKINNEKLDEFNRRTRFHSYEYFVVNSNYKNDFWFWVGEEPEDSWEKINKT